MPLYLCRWENGDFSIVQARSKDHALEMLDEIDNAEGLPLYPITDNFMAHFRLTDEGIVEIKEFGEEFGEHVRERVHPFLGGQCQNDRHRRNHPLSALGFVSCSPAG